MKTFVANIEKIALANTSFRKVLFTGQHLQLVVMCLKPNEEIGFEVHEIVDQFFRVESGHGKAIIEGQEFEINDGFAIIIPAGARHNIINTSSNESLQLYTIYTPPQHKDMIEHATKEIAELDKNDHI